MAQNANVAASEKATKKGPENSGQKVVEKISDRVLEKRRALGRGLESLLGVPRVVAPPPQTPPPSHPAKTGPNNEVGTAAKEPVTAPEAEPAEQPAMVVAAQAGETTVAALPQEEMSPTIVAEQAPMAVSRVERMAPGDGEEILQVSIDAIDSNPHQTRHQFDAKALEDLADSIRVHGLMQPVVVRAGKNGGFTLILGERRLRAARMAGVETVPVIVRRVSDQQAAEMTVIENLQRQDLDCVDQAAAFDYLSKQFHLTQEEIGARVGVSRETVANYMRLLILPEGVIGALQKGRLTFSHARVLLKLRDNAEILKLATKAIDEELSVAQLENLLGASLPSGPDSKKEGGEKRIDPNVLAAQRSLEIALGMRVQVRDRSGRGRIVIEYRNLEDFDRVVGMLKGTL